MKSNIIREVKLALENLEHPKDRAVRIKSRDDNVFKKAYEELKASFDYVKANFQNTSIFNQYQGILDEYTPRYELLTKH